LVPFFPPIRRVRSDRFAGQWGFDQGAICGLPFPGNAFQFVVFRQAALPEFQEKAGPTPFLKNPMGRGRANAEFFFGQSVPNQAGAEHVHERREDATWCGGFSSAAGFALVNFVRIPRLLRDKRLHDRPKFIRNFPGL